MSKKNIGISTPVFLLLLVFALVFFIGLFHFTVFPEKKIETVAFLNIDTHWADSVLQTMTIEDKIGQMLIYRQEETLQDKEVIELLNWIDNKQLSGVFITSDSLITYLRYLQGFDNHGSIPLFRGIHSPNGFPNFVSDIISFPSGTLTDAISNDTLLLQLAGLMAEVTYRSRINLSISPTFRNILNIEDTIYAQNVLKKAMMNFDALHKKGIIACLDGFSHENYFSSITQVESTMPYYQQITGKGLQSAYFDRWGAMTDSDSSVSSRNISLPSYIANKAGFKGLIISEINHPDSLVFSGVRFIYAPDLFIIHSNPEYYINKFISLLKDKQITEEDVNYKVRRILLAKHWISKQQMSNPEMEPLTDILNASSTFSLSKQLFRSSITLVKDHKSLIPIVNLQHCISIQSIGEDDLSDFQEYCNYYKQVTIDQISVSSAKIGGLKRPLPGCLNLLILNSIPLDSALIREIMKYNQTGGDSLEIALIHFGNIQSLPFVQEFSTILHAYDNSQESQRLVAQALFGGIGACGILPYYLTDSLLCGQCKITVPFRLRYTYPEEVGIKPSFSDSIDAIIQEAIRLYAFPGCQVFVAKSGNVIYNKCFGYHTYENINRVKMEDVYDIASVTKIAATTMATMKMIDQGKMHLDDSLENYFKDTHIEYTKIKPDTIITIDTILITKVKNLAKLISGADTIHLNDSVIVVYDTIYFKVTPRLNLFKRQVRDLLMHKSGLPPAMPVLRYILYKEDTVLFAPDTSYFSQNDSITDSLKISLRKRKTDSVLTRRDSIHILFNKYYTRDGKEDSSKVMIAAGMYLRKKYSDTLWIDTKQIRVYTKAVYMYSDVNMIVLQIAIDSINGYSITEYLDINFYKRLGLQTIGYKPLDRFGLDHITPTVDEKYWRGQLLHGYVHDESAALQGGIAGNAGIFSNAHDLGVLFQMVLNGGVYGGKRYLQKSTIDLFTSTQPDSYRGLGFDKASENNILAGSASPNSYGHTGFTGTCVWVDPDNELVFVFLSNRVHPMVKNWQINTLKVRQRIHQAVYDAMEEP